MADDDQHQSTYDTAASADPMLTALQQYADTAAQLPAGDDYSYNKAFRGFPKAMKRHNDALLRIIDRIAGCNFPEAKRVNVTAARPEQRHTVVMDAVDTLHEAVDHLLDECHGAKLRGAAQLDVAFGAGGATATSADFSSKVNKHLARPQEGFAVTPDNSGAPFKPLLFAADGTLTRGTPGVHPFEAPLKALSFTEKQLMAGQEQLYPPLETTPLVCVDTVEGLEALAADLATVDELAIDLEHHNFHSYLGFTCLMQLSTRTTDYVIDVIALRSEMYRLLPAFTDPSKVKVLHAAHEDIRWLQKDFGLYVVNMFDTGLALQALHMPHSLAFCVDHFCQVKLDKTYQTADWRLRPLPVAYVNYARQDTHYLLYCYDRLRALLLQADARGALGNLLVHVLHESRRRCLMVYEKERFDPDETWRVALGKSIGGLDDAQRAAARAVFNWREGIARAEDESPPAVLHTASVLALATRLPTCARDVIKLATPATVYLRRDAASLATMIIDAAGTSGADAAAAVDANDAPAAASAWAQRRRAVGEHRPMTGTLASLSDAALTVRVFDAAPKSSRAGKKQRAAPVAPACTTGFVRFAERQAANAVAAAQVTLSVPLPGVVAPSTLLQPVKRARAESSNKKAAAKADADADNTTAQSPAARPAASPGHRPVTRSSTRKASSASPGRKPATRSSTQRATAAADELPPSLADEYGGLGRQTRRRAKRDR